MGGAAKQVRPILPIQAIRYVQSIRPIQLIRPTRINRPIHPIQRNLPRQGFFGFCFSENLCVTGTGVRVAAYLALVIRKTSVSHEPVSMSRLLWLSLFIGKTPYHKNRFPCHCFFGSPVSVSRLLWLSFYRITSVPQEPMSVPRLILFVFSENIRVTRTGFRVTASLASAVSENIRVTRTGFHVTASLAFAFSEKLRVTRTGFRVTAYFANAFFVKPPCHRWCGVEMGRAWLGRVGRGGGVGEAGRGDGNQFHRTISKHTTTDLQAFFVSSQRAIKPPSDSLTCRRGQAACRPVPPPQSWSWTSSSGSCPSSSSSSSSGTASPSSSSSSSVSSRYRRRHAPQSGSPRPSGIYMLWTQALHQ